MPEGIEGSIGVVEVMKPEVAPETTPNFTPLKIQPLSIHSPKEQEILTKLAAYNEPEPDVQEQSQKPEDPYRDRLDQVRARAKEIRSKIAGKLWKDLPKETRDEINSLQRSTKDIFKEYFKATHKISEGKDILRYYSPSLTDEELEIAYKAYLEGEDAYSKIPGSHHDDYKERYEKYYPILKANDEILKEYGIGDMINYSFSSKFADEMDGLVEYEFTKLGLLPSKKLSEQAYGVARYRSKKGLSLVNKFFEPTLIGEYDQEVYKKALVQLYSNVPKPKNDHFGLSESQEAIKALKFFPTSEATDRLAELLYDPNNHDANLILSTLAEYESPESLIHMVFMLQNQSKAKEVDPVDALRGLHYKYKSDWPNLVEEFCQRYPQLSRLQSSLTEFEIREGRHFPYLTSMQLPKTERVLEEYMRDVFIGTAQLTGNKQVDGFITSYPISIYTEDLARNGLLTEEESKGVDQVFRYTSWENDKDLRDEANACRDIFAVLTSTKEERENALKRLKEMASISKVIEKNYLLDESKYDVMRRDTFNNHKRALEPLHSLLYKPGVTPEQAEMVLKTYASFIDFGRNGMGYGLTSFEKIKGVAESSEHFPFVLKVMLQFNRAEFIRYADREIWMAVGGSEGLALWAREAPSSFVSQASIQDWQEAFGEEAFIKWTQIAPDDFIEKAGKQEWKAAIGEDVVNKFLDVLPKDTDERRNAFLHNEYDRASEFIQFLLDQNKNYKDFFTLTTQDFEVLTDYVKQFGFSQDFHVFNYFKQLTLLEKGFIHELPPDIAKSGISSKQEFLEAIVRMKVMVYGEEPIMDLSKLTSFERANLRVVTGKASHMFDSGRPSFQRIIEDFERDVKNERIAMVPEGYKAETITLRDVKVEFDSSVIKSDFQQLATEVNFSFQLENGWSTQRSDLQELLLRKLGKIDEVRKSAQGNKKEYLEKEYARFEAYTKSLENVDSVDSLMKAAAQMKMDKTEKSEMDSILRKIVFRQLFSKNKQLVNELVKMLKPEWKGDQYETIITPEKILSLVNLIKEPIHEHVLDMKGDWEQYWSLKTREIVRANKDNLRGIFEPYYSKLKSAVEDFEVKAKDGGIEIKAIPDRGFIGEMSGYLANVCYTAEYPLLKGREVVPYKFVTTDKATGLPKFIGSVLVFEVDTEDGEGALLVRGFDVPKEADYDVTNFIENFLDNMTTVAKARGKKRVLLPGHSGAMSNYRMTINHITSKYGRNRTSLSERFAFNGYDLTNNSLVAREIPPAPSSQEEP